MRALAATLALVAVVAGSVGRAVWGWPWAGDVAAGALLAYLLIEGWSTKRTGRAILMAALAAAGAALAFHPRSAALLIDAAIQSAAVIGLFTALGFLREAAESSQLIQRCGDLMVRQPPGRRYAVLALGSHLIALVLNFGVLSLLGTMIAKGNTAEAAGGDPRIVAIRSRRMLTAVLRGFAAMTIWSPLSVSFAVTQNVVHGLAWWPLLGLQAVLTVLLSLLGWAMDRAAFPRVVPPPAATPASDAGWRPMLQLAALVGAVVAASVVAAELLKVKLVVGAMVVVPPAALVWLLAQHRAVIPALRHLARRLTVSMPGFRDEVAMIGGAMFLGTVVVAFVPPAETARLISMLGLPPTVLVVALSWSVMIFAQVGLSQIITVTLLGGALADLSHLGVPPLAMASGLMGAWALSACSTPVGAAVLTVARMGGVEVRVVARDWNARYVMAGAVVLALWLAGLVAVLG